MLQAIDLIAGFLVEGRKAFLADIKTQDAVIRRIEVLGEAARRVSEETRVRGADIPWTRIVGMRNELAHGYFSVDLEIVWLTVTERLPDLRARIAHLMTELDRDGNASS